MKYLESFKLFERKEDYQLFHKTNKLKEILRDGFIKAGEGDKYGPEWDMSLRKNVIANWKEGKFKTISATRNLDFLGLPALELDVEKISDKYKILPYIENLDYYLNFDDNKLEPSKNKHLGDLQNKLRSPSKNAGEEYWKVKTKKVFDFGINEELILTSKLDVAKYVKRIILILSRNNKNIISLINEKYPHIEVIELDKYSRYGYSDIKKAKQKELSKVKQNII